MRHVVTYTVVLAFLLTIGTGCAGKPKKGPSSNFSSKPAKQPRKEDEENKRNFNPNEADINEGADLDGNRPDIFGEEQDLGDGRGGLGSDIVDPGAGGIDGIGGPGFPSPSPGLEGLDVFPSVNTPRATPVPIAAVPTPTPTPGAVVVPPVRPGTLGLPFRSFNSNTRSGREVHGERAARGGRAIRGDSWTGTGSSSRRQRYVAE